MAKDGMTQGQNVLAELAYREVRRHRERTEEVESLLVDVSEVWIGTVALSDCGISCLGVD